jgi:hypothetical protein
MNDVNVHLKRNKHKNLEKILEGHLPEPDPQPDLLVKGSDPRIRIRTKMSRIRNTDSLPNSLYKEKYKKNITSCITAPLTHIPLGYRTH